MSKKPVVVWLMISAALVYAMVVIGGITRLTQSGLSIVEWEPISGTLPPTSPGEWQFYFEQYKRSPQYEQINSGMSLTEFKGIFFWEYLHRLLGRVVGLVFGLPLVIFWRTKQLLGSDLRIAFLILIFGGCQGVLGWYMVQSGLVDQPQVSPYRLAAHLSLALLILSLICCLLAKHLQAFHRLRYQPCEKRVALLASLTTALIAVQILFGAFMAGIKAGLVYNTFPTMHGHWLPPGLWQLSPWVLNFFENPVMVQLIHRFLGWMLLVTAAGLAWKIRRHKILAHMGIAIFFLVLAQFCLGVATLLNPGIITFASYHQALGTFLLLISVLLTYSLNGDTKNQIGPGMTLGNNENMGR